MGHERDAGEEDSAKLRASPRHQKSRIRGSIEDIVLQHDRRNVSQLRQHLARDYVGRAAQAVLASRGPVLIATGFFEIGPRAIETDGPPGAVAIGRALRLLGRKVVYVSDHYAWSILEAEVAAESEVVDFPIADERRSRLYARRLLERYSPGVVIAVERCSLTALGRYLNMSGSDISAFTARLDYLFGHGATTVGIGDGGNEIGMGKLAAEIRAAPGLPDEPAATACHHLIAASVSNWGAYGLVAGLEQLTGRSLLPSNDEATTVITSMVARGAVDGANFTSIAAVDGFTLQENLEILKQLRELSSAHLRPA